MSKNSLDEKLIEEMNNFIDVVNDMKNDIKKTKEDILEFREEYKRLVRKQKLAKLLDNE